MLGSWRLIKLVWLILYTMGIFYNKNIKTNEQQMYKVNIIYIVIH